MPSKRSYSIPSPEWKCPHCGYIHHAADRLRLDSDNPQCRTCAQAFPAVPARPEGES